MTNIFVDNICNDKIIIFKIYKTTLIIYFFAVTAVLPTGKRLKDFAVNSQLFALNPGVEKFRVTLTVSTPLEIKGKMYVHL